MKKQFHAQQAIKNKLKLLKKIKKAADKLKQKDILGNMFEWVMHSFHDMLKTEERPEIISQYGKEVNRIKNKVNKVSLNIDRSRNDHLPKSRNTSA